MEFIPYFHATKHTVSRWKLLKDWVMGRRAYVIGVDLAVPGSDVAVELDGYQDSDGNWIITRIKDVTPPTKEPTQ